MVGLTGVIAAATAFLAGCGSERRLREEQDAIAPPSFELVDCEFASGLYGLVSPPAMVCVYLAPRPEETSASALAESLSSRGYDVERAAYAGGIELKGRRAELRVLARVGVKAVGAYHVPAGIPRDRVPVSVSVGEPES